MDAQENVARVLKPIWVCDGEISPAAFNLRPHIRETYISVLRESCETFMNDLKVVMRNASPVSYAEMNIAELRGLTVDSLEDDVTFDVNEIDNQSLQSHAGIFIFINGQQIVGGEPFESLELEYGTSADSILLTIRETLAGYAKKNIKQMELL